MFKSNILVKPYCLSPVIRYVAISIICFLASCNVVTKRADHRDWPVLKQYDEAHLSKLALPVGGIGTGTISIGGTGELRDWEIMNRPAKGFSGETPGYPKSSFFAIYAKPEGEEAITKALMGPVDESEFESKNGRPVYHHGLPRFEKAVFEAAYPFGQVLLEDRNMPVKVKLKAFNPLIPGDLDNSSIPVAVLTYEVENLLNKTVAVSVCANIKNIVGMAPAREIVGWKSDLVPRGAKGNRNLLKSDANITGIYMISEGMDSTSENWGTMAIAYLGSDKVTTTTEWPSKSWNGDMLEYWDDFSSDGILSEKHGSLPDAPMGSLSIQKSIPPGSKTSFTFVLSWHFPNRLAWDVNRYYVSDEIVGNYYTTKFSDAWDVIASTAPRLDILEEKTLRFVNSLIESDLPETVKEAALFNISTLRSQTFFRTADGYPFGWEGTMDLSGSCPGSCTHVWNYEQATPYLFGELAQLQRELEFQYATDDEGKMSFRIGLPLESNARIWSGAAADGQMGTIMKMYREWQLSGNDEFLKKHWPKVRLALEYAWINTGWDRDKDGVMEGRQHNTMDVDYYGPNPQMQIWYLGALRAAEEMASYLGDDEFANTCRSLFENGSSWTDENLFNGEYYEQMVISPAHLQAMSDGLVTGLIEETENIPAFQLGKGCLVDQMVGQYMAHVLDLGYLVKPENVKTTLQSILKYNSIDGLKDHFNTMRSFAMGDEAGLLMASWPRGRTKVPFPYYSEIMTGFEYTAAVGMMYEGMEEEGLNCIYNIRDRYDGRKRNPFNEAECGNHYARAMTSWASVPALTGFHYSAVDGTMTFDRAGNHFWSNGYAWGTCEISGQEVTLTVLSGQLDIHTFILKDIGKIAFDKTTINEGDVVSFRIN